MRDDGRKEGNREISTNRSNGEMRRGGEWRIQNILQMGVVGKEKLDREKNVKCADGSKRLRKKGRLRVYDESKAFDRGS